MTPARDAVALVESPAQLLNVLEWAHHHDVGDETTIVVLPPREPTTRVQLATMATYAREENIEVRWQEARGSLGTQLRAAASLIPALQRARRIVIGDPFSRFIQTLVPFMSVHDVTVVDDGTSTMEFTECLASGSDFTRWDYRGGSPVDVLVRQLSGQTRRFLTPVFGPGGHRVEVFSAMPVSPVSGVWFEANRFEWTRQRFDLSAPDAGVDIIGTSLVESGIVDPVAYLRGVRELTLRGSAGRYYAHRRESGAKLRAIGDATGLRVVRPDAPLELAARRDAVASTVVSFPSTVVYTLPWTLAGSPSRVVLVDVPPSWLVPGTTARASGFLDRITSAARARHGLESIELG